MSEDRIFEILFNEDEITWKALLMELVKSEQMNPWDIDLSALSRKYVDMVRKLQQMDFRVSGKVVLAAAILLRMKSDILLTDDLAAFDNMFNPEEESGLLEGLEAEQQRMPYERKGLIPRTPQPRMRKVSLNDLMDALQKALETNRRRLLNIPLPEKMEVPKKKFDITELMRNMYSRITSYFKSRKTDRLYFHHLVPEDTKEGKVLTFIPLLHLSNERRIDMDQHDHFGAIEIVLRTEKAIREELRKEAEEAG